ncbi:MAG: hypothetical protein U0800_26160 [Isosphaeraceae bacterium]
MLDVQPADRHLLLMFREGEQKSKFLCGHDERWFVAADADQRRWRHRPTAEMPPSSRRRSSGPGRVRVASN